MLPMVAATTFTSCGDDDDNNDIVDPIVDNNDNKITYDGIVVTIDANGNADGGHRFIKIDDTNFFIDEIKYTVQDGDLVVSGYYKYDNKFKGEAEFITQLIYNGKKMNVVAIKNDAFLNCNVITSAIIPPSVKKIGYYAFQNCPALTSVTIPENVTTIEAWAFRGCTALKTVTIPNSVTEIGGEAFDHCSSLLSVRIGSGVKKIGYDAFDYCNNLVAIFIKAETPPTIGSDTFSNRRHAYLYIPKGSKIQYETAKYWEDFMEIVEWI